MEIVIPDCFLPLRESALRSGAHYRDLRGHHFEPLERKFLAEEILGKHTLLEPTNYFNNTDQRTQHGLALRYNIPRTTIHEWVLKIDVDDEDEEQIFHACSGRPTDLDDLAIEEVCDYLHKRRKNRRAVMKTKLNHILRQKKIDTLRRRHKEVPDSVSVSYSSDFQIVSPTHPFAVYFPKFHRKALDIFCNKESLASSDCMILQSPKTIPGSQVQRKKNRRTFLLIFHISLI